MRLGDIIDILNQIAPFELAEPWDNCGLMVGDPEQNIQSIIVALDPSMQLIEHAINNHIDLIITHHPLFFKPIKSLNTRQSIGAKATKLICNSIALLSMHTNLDSAEGGIADTLADLLGIRDVQKCGVLRTGTINTPVPIEEWIRHLPVQAPRLCKAQKTVCRVGLCPGSGMDLWREALALGCDTFVTGDVKYHDAMDAVEAGLNIIDAGHFGTEYITLKAFVNRLRSKIAAVTCTLYEEHDIFIKPYIKENCFEGNVS